MSGLESRADLAARHSVSWDPNATLTINAFHYVPNQVAAAVYAALAISLAVLAMARVIRYRNWWGLCLPIGAAAFGGGFVCRILSKSHQNSLGLLTAEQILIVCSPAAFLGFNYVVFGRLVTTCFGAQYAIIRPTRVAPFFVASDIVTFLVQCAGAAMEIRANSAKSGANIFKIGLVLQLISYVIFSALLVLTHRRARHGEPQRLSVIKPLMWAMYISSALLIIRCTYRVVEGLEGMSGYLSTHEVVFYALDSTPLILSMAIYVQPVLNLWPGSFFIAAQQQPSQDYYKMQGRRDEESLSQTRY